MKSVNIGIIGGTGYTGVELLRILAQHPMANVVAVSSRAEAGRQVSEIFPSLRGIYDLQFSNPDDIDWTQCQLVFFATPNGVAMKKARELYEKGIRIIDLSADFRLKNQAQWEHWYGMQHACPELIEKAVYGLCELNREQIKDAQILANPGCYPTPTQLGFAPLIEHDLIDMHSLICDAKSGVSGAGRKADVNFTLCEVSESLKAYGSAGHRHLPEIKQQLNTLTDTSLELVFIPHLIPMIRGMHTTLYARLNEKGRQLSQQQLHEIFAEYYAHEAFVDVMPQGSHPDTRSVKAANHCRLAVSRPQNGDTVLVLGVIDNLVKGAAGQAVQNFNIMFGFAEDTALSAAAVCP